MAIMRNLFRGVGCLVTLVVLLVIGAMLVVAAWLFRDEIAARIGNAGGGEIVMSEPSLELAERIESALEAGAAGGTIEDTIFSEAELQSYVAYKLPSRLPSYIVDVAFELRDSTAAFELKVDLSNPELGNVGADLQRIAGDSVRVTGEALPTVRANGDGRVRLASLRAGIIPLPPDLVIEALPELGMYSEDGATFFDIPAPFPPIRIENEAVLLIRAGSSTGDQGGGSPDRQGGDPPDQR